MKYIFIILPIIVIFIIVIIVIIVKSKSISSKTTPPNSVWSGTCSGNLKTPCVNNNCAVLCDNNLLQTTRCSSMSNSCSGTDCQASCEPVQEYPTCSDGMLNVWQGMCPSLPEISSVNNQNTVKCAGQVLPIQPDRLKCKSLDVSCRKGACTVCCDPLTVPVTPSCVNSNEVWRGNNCGFSQQNCKDGVCTLSCNGTQVYSGNCGSMSTTCLSNGTDQKCVACCTADVNSPPVCGANKTQIWSGKKCNVITSSCSNGVCKANCDGVDIDVPQTCFKNISSTCNSSGCVVCCGNTI